MAVVLFVNSSLDHQWSSDEFTDKTTAINQMWQTDFTYFKIIGWGWYYLSTILDDYSRYIIAWKLCMNMRAEDVTSTIECPSSNKMGHQSGLNIGGSGSVV